MFTKVVAPSQLRLLRPRSIVIHPLAVAVPLAVGLLAHAPRVAMAQAEGADFTASVLDSSAQMQQVTVPLHRSVTIDTTVEIIRADMIAPEIADVQVVSPKRVLVTGRNFGRTMLVLAGAENKQVVIEISVELDLAPLNKTIKSIDPAASAEATSVLGNIVLTGTVTSTDRAERIAELAQLFLPPPSQGGRQAAVQNHMDLAGEQQVMIHVVVAEVSRTASRELGVNGFLAGKNFRDGFVVNQINQINPINIGAAADQLVTQNVAFLTGEDGIPISPTNTTLSLGFPRVQMQLFLKAMADNNLLRVLAEPNLVAVSGETATFLAGGEFPILVPQGDFRVTVEFREFGVRLNFTPVVRGHQQIRLHVAPEVSELDFAAAVQFQGFVVPGLTSRSAETVVELGSGQTIAIAGLLNERIRGVATRIPGIGDVPVLGTLFRSVQFQRSQTELVILVTPELVAPLEPHQKVRLPGDDVHEPNDMELYVLGLLESQEEAGASSDSGPAAQTTSEPDELSIHGPWGHTDGGTR